MARQRNRSLGLACLCEKFVKRMKGNKRLDADVEVTMKRESDKGPRGGLSKRRFPYEVRGGSNVTLEVGCDPENLRREEEISLSAPRCLPRAPPSLQAQMPVPVPVLV